MVPRSAAGQAAGQAAGGAAGQAAGQAAGPRHTDRSRSPDPLRRNRNDNGDDEDDKDDYVEDDEDDEEIFASNLHVMSADRCEKRFQSEKSASAFDYKMKD